MLGNDIKDKSATVIDFMGLSFTLYQNLNLTNRFETSLIAGFKGSNILVLVPDIQDIKDSNKSDERSRRQKSTTPVIEIGSDIQKVPRYFIAFLSNSENKGNLVDYLFDKWKGIIPAKLSSTQVVILADMNGPVLTHERCLPLEL